MKPSGTTAPTTLPGHLAQDITERKQAEALHQVSRLLEWALGGSDIGIFEIEFPDGTFENGRVVFTNVWEQLGYGRPESPPGFAAGVKLGHPDDIERQKKIFDAFLAGQSEHLEFEHRLRHRDGTYRTMLVRGVAVRDPAGKAARVIGSRVDITARKRAEEALRESEERYRSLISQVKDFAIFATDEHGVVTTWNEGCQHVLGYPQHEFVGLHTTRLFTPEDRAEDLPGLSLRHAAEAGTARINRWMIDRKGHRFFALGTTAALRDSAGRLIGFSTVLRDATQMKVSQDELAEHGESLERLVTERTDELKKTMERLRLSERMASLGTLAAGLGHDMGNLLLPLEIRLELLLQAALPPELHEHVLGIQKCAQYFQRLSNGLRLLAIDPNARTAERTELGLWWQDAGTMLRNVLPQNLQFDHDLPGAECWVAIGRAGLTQVIFNLVQNAADAMRERGSGRVLVSAEDDPRTDWVTLRVIDDGPGMTQDVVQRCMEPYFSTKARGESTGMGLAFVHGLVIRAGGRVEVASAVGRGTTVSLALPRTVAQADDITP